MRALHILSGFPEAGGDTLHFSHPWGRSCWPWPPPALAFCTDFKKAAPNPPSPELDCSSLVTLLLNNLQNGALPVFIREAFQVCAADFMPSWCSCWGGAASPCPAPGVTSQPRKGNGPCTGTQEESGKKIPVFHVGVLQAPCYMEALGKGHSFERRCLGFVSVSFFWLL